MKESSRKLNHHLHNIAELKNTEISQRYHRDYGVSGMTDKDTRLMCYRNHQGIPYIVENISVTLDSGDGVTHFKIKQVITLE